MNTTDKVQVGDSTTGTSTSTSYTISYKPSIEYGWACPRCGRINAPWKSQCDCSGNYWYPSWEKPQYDEWWKHVYCDSNTFKDHPETTTWKAPNSVCASDSATATATAKADPNVTTYVTATNPVVGGSDYWDENQKTWVNVPTPQSNTTTSIDSPWNKFKTVTYQIEKTL